MENHQSGGVTFLVLGGDVNRPIAGGVCEDLGFPCGHVDDGAVGDVCAFDGVGVWLPGWCCGRLLGIYREGHRRDGESEDRKEDRFHGEKVFGVGGGLLDLVGPKPTEGGVETVAAPVARVSSIGHFELVFVACKLEGCGEVLIREGPVTKEIVEVVFTLLDVHLEWLGRGFGFADESGVGPTASDVGEATDVA